ncbi:T6SS effector amidase Tae4 family protein [Chryseobacterium cucumeris]|uniref:T6SS effector amidase Tae4 family protein n=1 Tax=Chryseobacterium cucumeris TaxID=1813611 RepID=UPI003D96BBEB
MYSIDNENKSIGFTAKYTPEDRTKNYQIDNFTGTVEFTAMDGKPMGMKELSNGTPLPDKVTASKNSMNKAGDCSFSIRLIEVECNGEHHNPSQIAQCTANQKPYYVVEITEVCPSGGQPPKGFPNMGFYDGGGDSGGSSTSNEMSIQDSFNYMLNEAGFPELSAEEYTYIQNNQYIGGQLLSYFYNNLNQNNTQLLHWGISYFNSLGNLGTNTNTIWKELESKLNFAQQFFANNPNTSWEQFENWFLGTSEGKADEYYDTAYWDNPTLTFPPQSLPSWQNYYNAFPKDVNGKGLSGPAIYEIVKGTPKALRDDVLNDSNPNNDHDYDNACALRVSIALNYSGVKIPNIPNHTFKGGDGKYYFLSAKKLNAWMRKTFGTNPATSTTPYNSNHIHITGNQAGVNGVNLPAILKDKKGIYSLVSSNSAWASGHGDILQPNGTCINGCHFFDAPIDYIDVWILQ